MIELETYKKSLGNVADKLSEEEILKARQIQDDLAEIFFPLWLNAIKEKNNSIINKQLCIKTTLTLPKNETALSIVE